MGATASYTCNSGYTLSGNGVRTCQASGVWTNSDPSCNRECCMGSGVQLALSNLKQLLEVDQARVYSQSHMQHSTDLIRGPPIQIEAARQFTYSVLKAEKGQISVDWLCYVVKFKPHKITCATHMGNKLHMHAVQVAKNYLLFRKILPHEVYTLCAYDMYSASAKPKFQI